MSGMWTAALRISTAEPSTRPVIGRRRRIARFGAGDGSSALHRDAGLPCDPPVALGSTLAYALASTRNFVQMSIFEGATEDQVYGVVVDGIDRATAAGLRALVAETTPAE